MAYLLLVSHPVNAADRKTFCLEVFAGKMYHPRIVSFTGSDISSDINLTLIESSGNNFLLSTVYSREFTPGDKRFRDMTNADKYPRIWALGRRTGTDRDTEITSHSLEQALF